MRSVGMTRSPLRGHPAIGMTRSPLRGHPAIAGPGFVLIALAAVGVDCGGDVTVSGQGGAAAGSTHASGDVAQGTGASAGTGQPTVSGPTTTGGDPGLCANL